MNEAMLMICPAGWSIFLRCKGSRARWSHQGEQPTYKAAEQFAAQLILGIMPPVIEPDVAPPTRSQQLEGARRFLEQFDPDRVN